MTELLTFFQLPEDADLLLPVVLCARERGLRTRVLVSRYVRKTSSRTMRQLQEHDFATESVSRFAAVHLGRPALGSSDALLTATESNLRPHAAAHQLAIRMRDSGRPTFVVQHGLENLGLTYFDSRHPPGSVDFASDHVLLWGSKTTLHPDLPPATKQKCRVVGCPKTWTDLAGPPQEIASTPRIGIFENLHWDRYTDEFRRSFIAAVEAAVEKHASLHFLLKPHHSKRWFPLNYRGNLLHHDRFVVADPATPEWQPWTAPHLFRRLTAAVTTPSTVALDAARAGLAVAVWSADLEAPVYDPLPRLRNQTQLDDFLVHATDAETSAPLVENSREFHRRVLAHEDGASRIVETILQELSGIRSDPS